MGDNSTTPFSSWAFPGLQPELPPHCYPTSGFLYKVSAYTHSCIPIPLGFISTLVGCCSITSWLFAQLPQIYKNFQLSSASGLSMFFLVEWFAGDLSNFLGALFTGQAAWQVTIAFYYCVADIILVAQYFWYEHLRHGNPLKVLWVKRYTDGHIEPDPSISAMDFAQTRPVQQRHRVNSSSAIPSNRPSRKVMRRGKSLPFGSVAQPSLNIVITLSLLLAVVSRASPISSTSQRHTQPAISAHHKSTLFVVGTVMSWCSTCLYLISRLPQLIKNQRRQSTAGLSITLFIAAFLGNFFYSSSLILNPRAWSSYGPYGGHGWVDAAGSQRGEWVAAAAPFFLGAAGVLIMDACIFIQFLYFRVDSLRITSEPTIADNNADAARIEDDQVTQRRERILVVVSKDSYGQRKWKQVQGWMRGWKPSYSIAASMTATAPSLSSESSSRSRSRSRLGVREDGELERPPTPVDLRSPFGSLKNMGSPIGTPPIISDLRDRERLFNEQQRQKRDQQDQQNGEVAGSGLGFSASVSDRRGRQRAEDGEKQALLSSSSASSSTRRQANEMNETEAEIETVIGQRRDYGTTAGQS